MGNVCLQEFYCLIEYLVKGLCSVLLCSVAAKTSMQVPAAYCITLLFHFST